MHDIAVAINRIALSRRSLLLGLASSGAALMTEDGMAALRGKTSDFQSRPFQIDDLLNREEIIRVELSPDESRAVVVKQRTDSAGGFFGMFDNALPAIRCDLLVGDNELERLTTVTQGEDWNFWPVFSPDSSRLAAFSVDRDGRSRLMVLEPEAKSMRPVCDQLRPDLTASLIQGPHRSPITWVDDRRVMVVDTPGDYLPISLSGLRADDRVAALATRSIDGGMSVREWSSDTKKTCSVGGRLTVVDVVAGTTRIVASGDIRGVSMSPDRRLIAVLVATAPLKSIAESRIPHPVGLDHAGFDDQYVTLALRIIDLESGGELAASREIRAVGAVPTIALPVWADNSASVAIACRTKFQTEDAGNIVYVGRIRSSRVALEEIPAASLLDAFIVSQIAMAVPADALSRILAKRAAILTDAIRQNLTVGDVFRSGGVIVYSYQGQSFASVFPFDKITPLNGAVLGACAERGSGVISCLVESPEGQKHVVADLSGCREVALPPFPARSAIVGVGPRSLRRYALLTRTDCSQLLCDADGSLKTAMTINRHFAEVRVPRYRAIDYPGPAGEKLSGILYFPTLHDGDAEKLRVVVFAYPNARPRPYGSIGNPNDSDLSSQHLLASGFAVFHAALPLPDAMEANHPLPRIGRLVEAAADALDRQPEIAVGRYGFTGHSNGGYSALAAGCETNRLKAIVAAAPFPDLFSADLSDTVELRRLDCAPNVIQNRRFYYEGYRVPIAVAARPDLAPKEFIEQSPLYNATKYNTPTLLQYGEFDWDLPPVEKMFLVLQARNVPVQLDMFWGENHVLSSPENKRLMAKNQVKWFDRWL